MNFNNNIFKNLYVTIDVWYHCKNFAEEIDLIAIFYHKKTIFISSLLCSSTMGLYMCRLAEKKELSSSVCLERHKILNALYSEAPVSVSFPMLEDFIWQCGEKHLPFHQHHMKYIFFTDSE